MKAQECSHPRRRLQWLLAGVSTVALTQCGPLSTAAGVLTAPLRIAQGLAGGIVMNESSRGTGEGEADPGPNAGVKRRGREVSDQGVHRGHAPAAWGEAVTQQVTAR